MCFLLQEISVVVLNQKLSPDSDVAVMVCMQTLAVLGVERNSSIGGIDYAQKGGGRLCQVCQVKTELCFLLDCPSYSHIRDRHSDPFTHSSKFLKTADPAQYLRKWFFHRHFVLPDLDLASNFQGWRQLPRIIFPRRTAFDAAARLAWLESAPSHICFA